jgi:hypothetical protein
MLADKVPAGDGWIHELKHDGFRELSDHNKHRHVNEICILLGLIVSQVAKRFV